VHRPEHPRGLVCERGFAVAGQAVDEDNAGNVQSSLSQISEAHPLGNGVHCIVAFFQPYTPFVE
jgi:hypothetical protein